MDKRSQRKKRTLVFPFYLRMRVNPTFPLLLSDSISGNFQSQDQMWFELCLFSGRMKSGVHVERFITTNIMTNPATCAVAEVNSAS